MSDLFMSSIDRELSSDERLLWKGRPATGIRLRSADAFAIPFSLMWGGFAIFWEIGVLTQASKNNSGGAFMSIFGVPFVLMGLYFIFGRFFVDAKVRANTEYAVTNRRAIIVSGLFSKSVRSFDLQSMSQITLTEKADQSGTITFGPPPYGATQRSPLSFGTSTQQPAFEMIDNVRSVYETIEQAKRR
jgi:hypothetical protein